MWIYSFYLVFGGAIISAGILSWYHPLRGCWRLGAPIEEAIPFVIYIAKTYVLGFAGAYIASMLRLLHISMQEIKEHKLDKTLGSSLEALYYASFCYDLKNLEEAMKAIDIYRDSNKGDNNDTQGI